MSEAFLISGAIGIYLSSVVDTAVKTARIDPKYIDEVHVVTRKIRPDIPGLAETCPVSTWSDQPGLELLILQDACRQIISGARRLILLTQNARGRFAAILLAGPQMIGVHNLAPIARVDPGTVLSLQGQLFSVMTHYLENCGVEREDAGWMSPGSVQLNSTFPAFRPAPRSQTAGYFRLVAAAKALKPASRWAVLFSEVNKETIRFVLLEKV